MSDLLDQSGLLRELSQRCESAGSQSALAREIGVSVSQINEALHKRRHVSEAMANALGFVRVDRYRKLSIRAKPSQPAVARGEAGE